MRNDKTSKSSSFSMFCRFAFRCMNYRCYIGVLELAVYSLLGIRYYSFHLHHHSEMASVLHASGSVPSTNSDRTEHNEKKMPK